MQPLEYRLKVKPKLLQGSRVDKYIVKIGGDKEEPSANFVHQSLERAGRTTKPKWHVSEFVQAHASSGGESSLGSITGINRELPVPTLQVQGRKYSRACQSILDLRSREGVGIFDRLLVQFPVVHAKPNLPRLLPKKHCRCHPWAGTCYNDPLSSID